MVGVATKGEIKNRTAPRGGLYSSPDRVFRSELYPHGRAAVFDASGQQKHDFSPILVGAGRGAV